MEVTDTENEEVEQYEEAQSSEREFVEGVSEIKDIPAGKESEYGI